MWSRGWGFTDLTGGGTGLSNARIQDKGCFDIWTGQRKARQKQANKLQEGEQIAATTMKIKSANVASVL